MNASPSSLPNRLAACRLCADRFAATKTHHSPRPIVWFNPTSSILIAGQAPGQRVHNSGLPFDDRSGDRLRDWMGIGREVFYDQSRIAIVPMAFCFPGYNASGSDLPPPPLCAQTWRDAVLDSLPNIKLTLLIGGYAQKWHLPKGAHRSVNDTVANWRDHAPSVLPLPHPSWRNTGWLKKHPDVEATLLPTLRSTVKAVLEPQ